MVLSSPIVDEYQLWLNTNDPEDLAFLRSLEGMEKVRLVPHPKDRVEGITSIRDFFVHASSPDTIYIRFDDDIVWMEHNTIEIIARERIADHDAFLIAPTIINNAICTNILQNRGIAKIKPYVHSYAMDNKGWASAAFADKLHRYFIDTFIDSDERERYRFDGQIIGCNRFSINCVSWHGEDMAPIADVIERDEEEYLTCVHPARNGLYNRIIGATCVVHFAFFTQRESLDASGLLERYASILAAADWVDPDIFSFLNRLAPPTGSRDRIRSREDSRQANDSIKGMAALTVLIRPVSALVRTIAGRMIQKR